MQCAAVLSRAAPVVGRQCTVSRPSRSSVQPLQPRRVACRAVVQEDDNAEADDAAKPYSLPTSEELKQALKDLEYEGNLALPMLGIAGLLCLLASIFPGHA